MNDQEKTTLAIPNNNDLIPDDTNYHLRNKFQITWGFYKNIGLGFIWRLFWRNNKSNDINIKPNYIRVYNLLDC